MPFVSQAQERWAHTPSGRMALGPKLDEFDKASKDLELPERKNPRQRIAVILAEKARQKL